MSNNIQDKVVNITGASSGIEETTGNRFNGGLLRLREVMDRLPPAQWKVAQYIMDHPEQFLTLSVAELAQNCGGSQAAIIRLCKTMNYDGIQELRLKIVGDLQRHQIQYEEARSTRYRN